MQGDLHIHSQYICNYRFSICTHMFFECTHMFCVRTLFILICNVIFFLNVVYIQQLANKHICNPYLHILIVCITYMFNKCYIHTVNVFYMFINVVFLHVKCGTRTTHRQQTHVRNHILYIESMYPTCLL